MEKTKETLYDDTWDQEINTQVYLWPFLQILRILLEIFGLLLALDTPAQFLGDRNRGWNNFTEITQGRPSFFRQRKHKENGKFTFSFIVDPANSCEIFG
jgi:hypothetical protein